MGWDNPPITWRELERRLSVERDPPPPAVKLCPGDGSAPVRAAADTRDGAMPWAELHCHSSYSFLDGASSPAELVAEACRQGVQALAITDHDGMYGVAQFAQAAARRRADGNRTPNRSSAPN